MGASIERFIFDKVIFKSDDETYAIFRIASNNGCGLSAMGKITMPAATYLKASLEVTGEWSRGRFGQEFKFKEIKVPDAQKVIHFLTHIVGHITEKSAKEISNKYGEGIWDILDKTPNVLLEIKGIGQKKLAKIVARWAKVRSVFNLANMLSPELTMAKIISIANHFGDTAVAVIKSNPYDITQVSGIGFKIADKVALKMGMSTDDPKRLRSAAVYCIMAEVNQSGNTVIAPRNLTQSMVKELSGTGVGINAVDSSACLSAIEDMLNNNSLLFVHPSATPIKDRLQANDIIALDWHAVCEREILDAAKNVKTFGAIVKDIDTWITKYEALNKITFGDEQKDAIRLVNERPSLFAIAGYAGTGKTTVTQAIIQLLRMQYGGDGIVCCALSGIAANRIKNKSGFEANTIHRTFGFRGDGWEFNAQNKLYIDVLIVDEASMVNSEIMYRILQALNLNHTMIILLGDPAQLPPVGSAQPFTDLLDLNLIKKATLTKIFRQSAESGLVVIANEVRKHIVPDGINDTFTDFEYAAVHGNDGITQDVLRRAHDHSHAVQSYIARGEYQKAISCFQIITPQKKSGVALTTGTLNPKLQEIINPYFSGKMITLPAYKDKDTGADIDATEYRTGDKVVHLQNMDKEVFKLKDLNYVATGNDDNVQTIETRVMNGQLGIVVQANQAALYVYYPLEDYVVQYSKDEVISALDLAYALTVHKTQGSEYETVLMPLTDTHSRMLQCKLLYTAITRASKRTELIGGRSALIRACTNDSGSRMTCMQEWVDGASNATPKRAKPAFLKF